jgi:predicted RNase H-like HicB family nuclease
MTARHYPAIVEGDTDGGYSVFFPDLPGCTSGGDTLQETALNAEEALAAHLALMIENSERVPAPGCLDDLARPIEPDVVEASRLLVRVGIREKSSPWDWIRSHRSGAVRLFRCRESRRF